MKHLLTLGLLILFTTTTWSQDSWVKVFGGSGSDWIYSVIESGDDGVIIISHSNSIDGDLGINNVKGRTPQGNVDNTSSFSLLRLDGKGRIISRSVFCTPGGFPAYVDLAQFNGSERYVLYVTTDYDCWSTKIKDEDLQFCKCNPLVTGRKGKGDCGLIMIDGKGNALWSRVIGGSNSDFSRGRSRFLVTPSNRILVTGYTCSDDGDFYRMNKGECDVFVVCLDLQGQILWKKTFGGSGFDGHDVDITPLQDDYVITGETVSHDGDFRRQNNISDTFSITLDSNGNIKSKKYGRPDFLPTNTDYGPSIVTSDGGYIEVSNDYHNGISHIERFDSRNILMWMKRYGGSGRSIANSRISSINGGVVVAGSTNSNDGEFQGMTVTGVDENGERTSDVFLICIDSQGKILWKKTFGGSDDESPSSIVSDKTGGYIVSGTTSSNDGFFEYMNKGVTDIFVIKLDSVGNVLWKRTYGGRGKEKVEHLRMTSDGGIMLVGMTTSDVGDERNDGDFWNLGKGREDIFIMKLDKDGNLNPPKK